MSQIYWVIHRPGHGTTHKLQLKVSEKIWKSCQHCDAVCHIPVIYNYTNCTALLSMQYSQPYLSSTGWDPVTAKNPAQELSSNRMQCTNYWYKSLYSITIMCIHITNVYFIIILIIITYYISRQSQENTGYDHGTQMKRQMDTEQTDILTANTALHLTTVLHG